MTLEHLAPETGYTITVAAVDSQGAISEPSAPLELQTAAPAAVGRDGAGGAAGLDRRELRRSAGSLPADRRSLSHLLRMRRRRRGHRQRRSARHRLGAGARRRGDAAAELPEPAGGGTESSTIRLDLRAQADRSARLAVRDLRLSGASRSTSRAPRRPSATGSPRSSPRSRPSCTNRARSSRRSSRPRPKTSKPGARRCTTTPLCPKSPTTCSCWTGAALDDLEAGRDRRTAVVQKSRRIRRRCQSPQQEQVRARACRCTGSTGPNEGGPSNPGATLEYGEIVALPGRIRRHPRMGRRSRRSALLLRRRRRAPHRVVHRQTVAGSARGARAVAGAGRRAVASGQRGPVDLGASGSWRPRLMMDEVGVPGQEGREEEGRGRAGRGVAIGGRDRAGGAPPGAGRLRGPGATPARVPAALLQAFVLAGAPDSLADLEAHAHDIGVVYPTYFECESGTGAIAGEGGGEGSAGVPAAITALRDTGAGIAVMPRFNCQDGADGTHDPDRPARPRAHARRVWLAIAENPAYAGVNLDLENDVAGRPRRAHLVRRRARPRAACARTQTVDRRHRRHSRRPIARERLLRRSRAGRRGGLRLRDRPGARTGQARLRGPDRAAVLCGGRRALSHLAAARRRASCSARRCMG